MVRPPVWAVSCRRHATRCPARHRHPPIRRDTERPGENAPEKAPSRKRPGEAVARVPLGPETRGAARMRHRAGGSSTGHGRDSRRPVDARAGSVRQALPTGNHPRRSDYRECSGASGDAGAAAGRPSRPRTNPATAARPARNVPASRRRQPAQAGILLAAVPGMAMVFPAQRQAGRGRRPRGAAGRPGWTGARRRMRAGER